MERGDCLAKVSLVFISAAIAATQDLFCWVAYLFWTFFTTDLFLQGSFEDLHSHIFSNF